MENNRIIIKNAHVVCPVQKIDGINDILIEDGKIAEISAEIDADGANIINADGLTAVPGFCDMHVHLRDPGQTKKEDIFSGCAAAAAGGVTSLLCMPNTSPVIDNTETVEYILNKAAKASAKVYIAGSISMGLLSKTPTDLPGLKRAGIIAATDDGRPVGDVGSLKTAMKIAEEIGIKIVAHCEDLDIAGDGIINKGEVSELLGVSGIDRASENGGTTREIELARELGTSIHICHVSTKEAVNEIRQAKQSGVKVTAETAPHYFSLTEKELLKKDADFRMNPPLRTYEDVQSVIEGLVDGTLDAIATDHAPHTPTEKADFLCAPNGSIGMETSFAVGYTYLVLPGHLSLSGLVEKMSANPAQILNIPAGSLMTGSAADIALLNLNEAWTVNIDKLHGKSKNTPFKGLELCGKVKYTLLDGIVVYEDK